MASGRSLRRLTRNVPSTGSNGDGPELIVRDDRYGLARARGDLTVEAEGAARERPAHRVGVRRRAPGHGEGCRGGAGREAAMCAGSAAEPVGRGQGVVGAQDPRAFRDCRVEDGARVVDVAQRHRSGAVTVVPLRRARKPLTGRPVGGGLPRGVAVDGRHGRRRRKTRRQGHLRSGHRPCQDGRRDLPLLTTTVQGRSRCAQPPTTRTPVAASSVSVGERSRFCADDLLGTIAIAGWDQDTCSTRSPHAVGASAAPAARAPDQRRTRVRPRPGRPRGPRWRRSPQRSRRARRPARHCRRSGHESVPPAA